MNRVIKKTIFTIIIFLILTNFVYAQNENMVFLSTYFKLEGYRQTAEENITRVEREIQKNNLVIDQAQKLIISARKTNNKEAEQVATQALKKAKESLKKNEESLERWKHVKFRLDYLSASLRNNMGNQKIKGIVSDYSGRVDIFKANGEKTTPDNPFLEPGDKIWTYDGTVKVEMLDGRASTTVGPWSTLELKDESPTEQVWELIKGKIQVTVEKIEEYKKRLKEKAVEEYKDLKIWVCSKIRAYSKEYEVLTPEAVIGPRGTKFELERDENDILKLTVSEGIVEVSFPALNTVQRIEKGEQAEIFLDGKINRKR